MYDIHELANLVAMANDKEQLALTEDIKANGQEDPAVLWKGKIVDGRCRQLACEILDIELKVRKLNDNLSHEEVSKVVKSLNTRRNLTMTQKIMSAVQEQERTGETNISIAQQWAISDRSLKSGKYIKKHKPEFVDHLFNGESVIIQDYDKGFDVTTNKINTLARLIKKELELDLVIEDTSGNMEFSVDGNIKTEMGKEWYYTTKVGLNLPDKGTEIAVSILLVELANLKFKLTKG